MHVSRWLMVVFFVLTLGRITTFAADTGTISGLVVDRDGQPVSDATATIAGDRLPSGRSVVTGANGLYLFEYLIPGEYTIQVEKAGISGALAGFWAWLQTSFCLQTMQMQFSGCATKLSPTR